jgi:hypothetical protein
MCVLHEALDPRGQLHGDMVPTETSHGKNPWKPHGKRRQSL